MKIDSGNALNGYGGGANFDTHPDYRHDFFAQVQHAVRGVGDIESGKADGFVDRAYRQNHWHVADEWVENQKRWEEDDMVNNTPGRDKLNYRRMEYDIEPNPNGKGVERERSEANERKPLSAAELVNHMRNHVYSMCTTASAVGNAPITQSDYADQIKLR